MLFFGRKKASALTIPWCTYTDPEIAHVGLYEEDAKKQDIPIMTIVQEFHDVDRAILDGDSDGFVKVHVHKKKDKVVGDYNIWEDKVDIKATVQRARGDAGELEVTVKLQACSHKGVCLLPAEVTVPVK